MLPLLKIFSLVLRVFTRPLINYTKRYHIGNKDHSHPLLRVFFTRLGNFYHRRETKINRKFLNIATPDILFVKPLAEDVAIEKGVEFFYEVVFYIIMIGLPLWEMYKAQIASDSKSLETKTRMTNIENGIASIKEKSITDFTSLSERLDTIEKVMENQAKSSSDIAMEFNILKYEIMNVINEAQKESQVAGQLDNRSEGQGDAQGGEQGYAQGVEQSYAQGVEQDYAQVVEQSYAQVVEQGYAQGIEQGYTQGVEQRYSQDEDQGLNQNNKQIDHE